MRVLIILIWLFGASIGLSQTTERRSSHCIALARDLGAQVYRANLPEIAADQVYLHYIAHASFLLRTAGGLEAVTDFTGFTGTRDRLPDIVTMNHAHDTHWTPATDPGIPHVLPGWGLFGEGIDHRLDLGEMLVRNVSTDIRSQFSGVEHEGNSIFIFEVAGLCIGHLGHLHHEPSAEHYAAIGRLDVVMAPVDGGYTLPQDVMVRVLKRLRSSVVIPMHWFSTFALEDFLEGMKDDFSIVEVGGPGLLVSLVQLPSRPTIMVLRPAWLRP